MVNKKKETKKIVNKDIVKGKKAKKIDSEDDSESEVKKPEKKNLKLVEKKVVKTKKIQRSEPESE